MTNSTLKCAGCKERYPSDSDEWVTTPMGRFHTFECAIAYAKYQQERRKKRSKVRADKEQRKEKRDNQRGDVSWQHKQTQKSFNRMRVLEELAWYKERGLDPVCISCGKPLGNDQWCCGHFKTVGATGGLRYDRKNTHLQHNRRCNMMLSGDIYGTKTTRGYVQGLLERFGEADGQAIIDYCDTHTEAVKWDWRQLEEMRKEFNAKIRELEKELDI